MNIFYGCYSAYHNESPEFKAHVYDWLISSWQLVNCAHSWQTHIGVRDKRVWWYTMEIPLGSPPRSEPLDFVLMKFLLNMKNSGLYVEVFICAWFFFPDIILVTTFHSLNYPGQGLLISFRNNMLNAWQNDPDNLISEISKTDPVLLLRTFPKPCS